MASRALVFVLALAGCTTSSTGNTITATWAFEDIATGTTTGCPVGFDTVVIQSQEIDPSGNHLGPLIADTVPCAANLGTTKGLSEGIYNVVLSVTDGAATVYATSLPSAVDISLDNGSIPQQVILNDGGYFHVQWTLVGAVTQSVLTCDQAGDPGGIAILSTLGGATTDDHFNCDDGEGVSEGLVAGSYTVAMRAETNGSPIGSPTDLSSTILPTNQITELGNVSITIDGM
jgi:hypothetical protein